MSEGHGPEPPGPADEAGDPDARTTGRRPPADPAAVLLAVERVGAEVAALARQLAAQPEEVAARLDVDAAAASVAVRISALGATLDQLRLSLLAALDRAAEHADDPAWLPEVQATLSQIPPALEAPPWLPRLQAALAEQDEEPSWLRRLQVALAEPDEAPGWLREVQSRLDKVTASVDAVLERMAQQERSVSSHLDRVGERLAEVAALVERDQGTDWQADQLAALAHRQDELGSALVLGLDRIEAQLRRTPATALRLAELRAQRAEVQARLKEERLLAADAWDDDR